MPALLVCQSAPEYQPSQFVLTSNTRPHRFREERSAGKNRDVHAPACFPVHAILAGVRRFHCVERVWREFGVTLHSADDVYFRACVEHGRFFSPKPRRPSTCYPQPYSIRPSARRHNRLYRKQTQAFFTLRSPVAICWRLLSQCAFCFWRTQFSSSTRIVCGLSGLCSFYGNHIQGRRGDCRVWRAHPGRIICPWRRSPNA